MIGSSNLFRGVLCPLSSNCDRPYCQFQHPSDTSQQTYLPTDLRRCNYETSSFSPYSGENVISAFPSSSKLMVNNNTTSNVVISQEETSVEGCYIGYVGSVEPTKSNEMSSKAASVNQTMNSYGQSFDYSGEQNQSIYAPTSNYSYGMEVNSSFSNLQAQQSLYAPEDPVFSSFHQPTKILTSSTLYKPYVPFYQQSTISNESQFHPQQHKYQQLSSNDVASSVFTPEFSTPQNAAVSLAPNFDASNNQDESSRKREKYSSFKNDNVKRSALALQTHKHKYKKSLSAVYVPTPIAELERQKMNAKDRKLQRLKEEQNKQNDKRDKESVRAVARNRSPAADEFSVIPKLPIDLADDEILNPAKRGPPSKDDDVLKTKTLSTVNRSLATTLIDSTLGTSKKPISTTSVKSTTTLEKNKASNLKLKMTTSIFTANKNTALNILKTNKPSIIIDTESSNSGIARRESVCILKNKKLLSESERVARTKKKEQTLTKTVTSMSKDSASVVAQQLPLDGESDSCNESLSLFDKVDKRFVELERYRSKQDRLGNLNATARAIADIDRKIAEKERSLRNLIIGEKPQEKTHVEAVWNKAKSSANVEKLKSSGAEFDINSLFDDVEQTFDKIGTSKRQKVMDEDNDDCLIFPASIAIKKKRLSEALIIESGKSKETTSFQTTEKLKPLQLSKQSAALQNRKIPTAVEQMKNRFAALSDVASSSSGLSNLSNTNVDGFEKGEARKTFSTPTCGSKKLAPLDIYNKKVAYSARIKYLQKIYEEYKKFSASDGEAIDRAMSEEKSIVDKISTRPAYATAVANCIRRIRDSVNGKTVGSSDIYSISHQDVLAGKHVGTFSIGVHRAEKVAARNNRISELKFYNILMNKYLLNDEQLVDNGFPRWVDVESKTLVTIKSYNPTSTKHGYVDNNALSRICNRCGIVYHLTKDGDYSAQETSCVFHWGKAWKKRTNGAVDSRYTCCDQDLSVKGCVVGEFHVTETQRMETLSDFVEPPLPTGVGDLRSHKVYAIDCEMVYGVWGPMLARVSVVDMADDLLFDKIIRPQYKVIDANTRFSGLTIDQLQIANCTFNEAREQLFELINQDTILIGHSLESDLKALRIVHSKVVDTSVVFPHRLGPPKKRALKTITLEILQKIIQEDVSGHDSKEDASACMKIMLHKVEKMN